MTPEEIQRRLLGAEFKAKWESLVIRGTTPGACWRARKKNYDDRIQLPGTNERVKLQRVSWFYSRGEWPEKAVGSTCKTDGCFNPDHLVAVRNQPEPKAKKSSTAFASLAHEYAETIRMVSSRQDWAAMSAEERGDVERELRALRLIVSQVIKAVEKVTGEENVQTD